MEYVVLLIGLMYLLGWLAAKLYSFLKLQRLRARGLDKSEYEPFNDLSPAEFGAIERGSIGSDALAAEWIYLNANGFAAIVLDETGYLRPVKVHSIKHGLGDIERALLKQIPADGPTSPIIAPTDMGSFRHDVLKSLKAKGWLLERKDNSAERLQAMQKLFAICLLLFFGAAILTVSAPEWLWSTVVALVALGLIVITMTVSLMSILVGQFRATAEISLRGSVKYHQDFQKLQGLYQYLRVSGMDTMTPNYADPNFTELDHLYAYAVAAGLDKRIVRAFF